MMPFRTWTVFLGDTWRLEDLPAGTQVRIEGGSGNPEQIEASDGAVSWRPPDATGYYYVGCRTGPSAEWMRIGVIVVTVFADEIEGRLIREVARLDDLIAAEEAPYTQVQGADGTGYSRIGIVGLRRQRAHAEARLADYRRRRDGRPPASYG